MVIKKIFIAAGIIFILLLFLEGVVRIIIDLPAKTDFYSSIKRDEVSGFQKKFGVKVNTGRQWVHLGWVADPEKEVYRVHRVSGKSETLLGETKFGSFLIEKLEPETVYSFRVSCGNDSFNYTVTAATKKADASPVLAPRIASKWRPVFKPSRTGSYINDHSIYQSRDKSWHLTGITAFGEGDYSKEVYFAHGVSAVFPPGKNGMMKELDPVADFGRLAWAPHVIKAGRYYMWYSPYRVYCATSDDGYAWREEKDYGFLPYNPQFRDPMVLEAAGGQWLMYATARDGYYSTVDVYQSFDMVHWQYIRPALKTAFGAERAGAQASTESPFVLNHAGHYYLSITYNNDSFFWNPLLLTLKVWLGRESYNDTLVFHGSSPYTFGTYRGRGNPSSLVAVLEAHAPEYVNAGGKWYITTAGWPWMASLTGGEAAVADLEWVKKE